MNDVSEFIQSQIWKREIGEFGLPAAFGLDSRIGF
jgi:hypothetical protein